MTGSSAARAAGNGAQLVPLRCPEPRRECLPGRLLANLQVSGEKPQYVHPDNLIEMHCHDCTERYRREGRSVKRVLHRFSFIGELVETFVEEFNADTTDPGREAQAPRLGG